MKTILSLLLVLVCLTAPAQDNKKKEKKVDLYGYITDSFTKASVPVDSLLKIIVLNADSSVVDTAGVWRSSSYYGLQTTVYDVKVPARPAKYIIKAMHPDYETTYMNYEIKRIARNREFELPNLRMRRIQRSDYDKDGGNLQEVVVKATRVKMVYKGDTIVFNADAFNVPEGSMLDGLIKQLPGVELKDNGEIFVNGKKIENLTLNGADFFKGKNKMMLENLPYYSVKNVQVYNKQTPRSKFSGRDVEQKEYTMDVVLKREYNVGGTAFVEAGYGTDNRYKYKGFGLRYSDHLRAVLFGGANNLNEYIDYDREGNERDRTNASGDRNVKQIGGLLTLNATEERINNTTEYNLRWEDNHTESRSQSENYMADTSTFGKNDGFSENRPFSMNVRNTFQVQKPFFLYSWLDFDYDHDHSESESTSLTAKDILYGDLINKNTSRSMRRGNRMSLNFNNNLTFKMPWGDELEMQLNGSMGRSWNNHSFSQNSYTFYNTGVIDQRNQYNDSPNKGFSLNGSIGYRFSLTENFSITPTLNIGYDYNDNDNNLYRLDWLGKDWAVDGPHAIGSLPDNELLPSAFDGPNSAGEGNRQNSQSASLEFSYNKQTEKAYVYLSGSFSEKFRRDHMTYNSDVLNTSINKNYNFPQVYVYGYLSFDNWRKTLNVSVQNYSNMPGIRQLVDIESTNNPLNISKGNPDLKPMNYWSFYVSYSSRKDSIDQHMNISLNSTIQRNAFANAYTYEPTTGVYTSWTENINGNWNMSGNMDYNRALGEKKFWHVGATLNTSISQSTDMSSLTGQTEAQRNRVTSTRLGFSPNVRFQKDKLTFTLKGAGSWQHIHRSINVTNMPADVYDFSYGFNANYQLPWHFTVDTDLQMHSRRGYADSEMNDNRLYWDATLTKSWKQGRWIAKLKCYDLLGQVSHLQYWVSSQGRTEYWTNNMRRYVMLSLSYRFTLTPKHKN